LARAHGLSYSERLARPRKATKVIIKTLDELRQTDDRTLRFTPMGLGLGVQMRPDDAAEYQQKVVAQGTRLTGP
jgi:hypothetical protein